MKVSINRDDNGKMLRVQFSGSAEGFISKSSINRRAISGLRFFPRNYEVNWEMLRRFLITDAAAATLLIRLMVGAVFLSEGFQKFLFPAARGAGRFEKIGLPFPEFLGPFVGGFEVLCGALVLIGLFTRFASIPLIVIMLTAFATTKMELLAGGGVWEMLHGSRTDWSMLLGSLFLLINGGGKWSLDRQLVPSKS